MAMMPNYYQNPYGNYGQFGTMPTYQQQQTIPQPTQLTAPTPFGQNNISTISGKIIENIEMSKTQEIIPGGYGVFPLTDFSKVIIKAYDKDGNLQYLTYDLVKPEEVPKEDPYQNKLNDIYAYIEKLDKKMDGLGKPAPATRKKKVVQEVDEYDE